MLSVIIPVYNEKNTLEEIIDRVQKVDLEKEIILVDDASTDGTRGILKSLEEKGGNIKVYYHGQNQGKGAALRTGFAQAEGDYVIVQDADLEYDPRDFHKLLEPIKSGEAEVVYGSRFIGKNKREIYKKGNMHLPHLVGNKFLTFLTNILYGASLSDMETCYKLLPVDFVKSINIRSDRFNFEPEITAKILKRGLRIKEVPISYEGREVYEGKKIGPMDGLVAVWTLLKFKFTD